MITKELQDTLNRAANEAIKRRHEYLTLEHFLLALLQDRTAGNVIIHCGGDIDILKRDLEDFFAERLQPLPEGEEPTPEQTPAFRVAGAGFGPAGD